MNQAIATIPPEKAGEIMEAVIAKGDLSRLEPNDRARYYRTVCESIGLNPLTKPFEYITLNGKLTLYARKDCTDQLRKIYNVSVTDMTETREEGLVIVTVKVRDHVGRTDMAKGAVTLKGLQGEALANAFMKCETKAKRRATLSICGLGFLDETEVETISNAHVARLPKKDAKDIYSRLQTEIDDAADIEDWLLKNEVRLLVLPQDWENILRLRIQERQQTPIEPAETVIWDEPEDGTPPEWDSKWDALGPVKQAGVLCSDAAFWKFLSKTSLYGGYANSAEEAAAVVRKTCEIESRSELATDKRAAAMWRQIVSDYRAWQREPEIVEVSPPPSAVEAAAPEPPAPALQAGAAVPTAAEYYAQWDAIINRATSAPQVKTAWNNQADVREQIKWTEQHAFKPLQKIVRQAIDFLEDSK